MMIMDSNTISFNDFIIANAKNFPAHECTEVADTSIYESPNWYECVLLDADDPNAGYLIMILRPYIYRDEMGDLYGWVSENPDVYYDNIYGPIHNDRMAVIAFKPASKYKFDLLADVFSARIRENWIGE